MEFWASVNVLRRRWYVLIPCLIFFGALAGLVLAGVKPTYQVTGKVLFVQPPQSKNTQDQNPLAGSPAEFATLVAPTLSNNAFKDSVRQGRGQRRLQRRRPVRRQPLHRRDRERPEPRSGHQLVQHLLPVDARDNRRVPGPEQASTPSIAYSPRNLGPPDGPTKIIGAKVKALIFVGGVGLIVSLGLTFLVDSMAAARKRRKAAEQAPTPIEMATSTSPFRLLDQLSDPDYGSRPPAPDVDDPHEPDRATGI